MLYRYVYIPPFIPSCLCSIPFFPPFFLLLFFTLLSLSTLLLSTLSLPFHPKFIPFAFSFFLLLGWDHSNSLFKLIWPATCYYLAWQEVGGNTFSVSKGKVKDKSDYIVLKIFFPLFSTTFLFPSFQIHLLLFFYQITYGYSAWCTQ